MPFWISFVYREARVGALREQGSKGIECGKPVFPMGFPDTAAGKTAALENRKELMTKHFKYPPNKRPNLEILGVKSPFYPLWNDLVEQWSLEHSPSTQDGVLEDFYVMRRVALLKRLHKLFLLPVESEIDKLISESNGVERQALVFVKIDCEKGASASEFSAICLPDESEMGLFKITNKTPAPVHSPHKATISEKCKTKKANEYIENLPKGDGLVNLCSRKLLGYVIAGSFAFSSAHKTGNGFCSYLGLLTLLKRSASNKMKPIVLLREQHEFNYHYATVTVPL